MKSLLPSGVQARKLPLGIGRGLRMQLDLRDGHVGLYVGLYEAELNKHLRRLCYRGARSFDLGGHIGYDALVLAKLSGAAVVSVEASPALCEQIEENVRLNPNIASRVTALAACVGSSSREPDHVTLDELVDRFFVPDFVKIDIEGAELDALLGATRLLDTRHPGLLVEVHSEDLERECVELLRRHRYEPKIVDQRRILRDHRPAAHNRWLVAGGVADE